MKRTIQCLKASSTFAVMLGVLTLSPHAAAQNQPLAHATIPFAFQVGDRTMPGGDYLISNVTKTTVKMDDRATGSGIFASVLPSDRVGPPARGSVTFRKYGNTYFLSGMAVPDSTLEYKCRPGKRETELSRMNNVDNMLVAINAGRP